jgi:thiazole synthase
MTTTDPLVIAGRTFTSRLVLGTSRYPNQQVLLDALTASGTEMVTVSIRRISVAREGESLLELLGPRYHLLPNTAGCYTARDAVVTAKLAREALETDWVKLEVIGDDETLFPDVEQLLPAAEDGGAHRLGHGDSQPLQPRHHPRAGPYSGDRRRRGRDRLRRGGGDGARL